jgi:hypothetical protein
VSSEADERRYVPGERMHVPGPDPRGGYVPLIIAGGCLIAVASFLLGLAVGGG